MTLISSVWTSQFVIVAGDKRVKTGSEVNDTVTKLIYRDNFCIGFHGENQSFEGTPIFPDKIESFLEDKGNWPIDRITIGLLSELRPLDRILKFGLVIAGRQDGEIFVYHIEPGKCRVIPHSELRGQQNIIFNNYSDCPGASTDFSDLDKQLRNCCNSKFWSIYRNNYPMPEEITDYINERSKEELTEILKDLYKEVGENNETYSEFIYGGPDIAIIDKDTGLEWIPSEP